MEILVRLSERREWVAMVSGGELKWVLREREKFREDVSD